MVLTIMFQDGYMIKMEHAYKSIRKDKGSDNRPVAYVYVNKAIREFRIITNSLCLHGGV